MKRLSGGAVLLNLTDISLGLTSGEVSITDAGVLGELTELRNFIDTQRDFSKGFKSLKPVLVEYRSSASKFNGIALANLSFNTDALHMSIGVNTIQADGKMLVITINVVYAWSDYIGYTISSAKLNAYETLATGDGTFTGDVGVGGDLAVTGDASVGGDITITGKINNVSDPSVKPIYCHPITVTGYKDATHSFQICQLIFNNSASAFTYADWINFIKSIPWAYFMSTGTTISGTHQMTNSYMSYLDDLEKLYISGVDVSDGSHQNIDFEEFMESFTLGTDAYFTDGVNKIN